MRNLVVGVCMDPHVSHLAPSFPIARKLREVNVESVYIVFDEFADYVTGAGFRCLVLRSVRLEEIKKCLRATNIWRLRELMNRIVTEIQSAVVEEKFAALLVDPCGADACAIAGLRMNVPVVYMYTADVSAFGDSSPPCSAAVYMAELTGFLKSQWLAWLGHYVLRHMNLLYLGNLAFGPRRAVLAAARRHGVGTRFDIYGKSARFPRLALYPRRLDLMPSRHAVYAGISVDTERMETIPAELATIGGKIILCSLGTLSKSFQSVAGRAYRAILDVARNFEHERFVLHIGSRFPREELGLIPANVLVMREIPQLWLLARAKLMITHGGAGSIKECIYHQVPMLVLPCVNDQFGNAAKVARLGIGSQLPPWNRSAAALRKRIKAVLASNDVHSRLAEIRSDCLRSEELADAAKYVRAIATRAIHGLGAPMATCSSGTRLP